jgi:hypothetical protein
MVTESGDIDDLPSSLFRHEMKIRLQPSALQEGARHQMYSFPYAIVQDDFKVSFAAFCSKSSVLWNHFRVLLG